MGGYLIGCAAPTQQIAQGMLPLALMPQMLFAGFMVNLDSIPVYLSWIKSISFFRYTYEALVLTIWGNWGSIGCEGDAGARCFYTSGDEVIELLSMNRNNLHTSLWALVGICSV